MKTADPFVVSRVLEAQGESTLLTLRCIPVGGSSEVEWRTFDGGRESMKTGWGGTLEQFAAYLAII